MPGFASHRAPVSPYLMTNLDFGPSDQKVFTQETGEYRVTDSPSGLKPKISSRGSRSSWSVLKTKLGKDIKVEDESCALHESFNRNFVLNKSNHAAACEQCQKLKGLKDSWLIKNSTSECLENSTFQSGFPDARLRPRQHLGSEIDQLYSPMIRAVSQEINYDPWVSQNKDRFDLQNFSTLPVLKNQPAYSKKSDSKKFIYSRPRKQTFGGLFQSNTKKEEPKPSRDIFGVGPKKRKSILNIISPENNDEDNTQA
jgi:hypothetical protein